MAINPLPDDFQINTRGSFLIGSRALFFFNFPDINGTLFDPSTITVAITNPAGTDQDAGDDLDHLRRGEYAFAWFIPADAVTGLYTIVVTYTVEQLSEIQTLTLTERFVIGEKEVNVITAQVIAFRRFVESLIGETQRIPVNYEIGRFNVAKTIAEFSFKRWNQPAGARIHLNGILRERGFTVDYLKGKVHFDNPLDEADEVYAQYNFRWFEDDELDDFVSQSIEFFNSYAPHSTYIHGTLPPRYGVTVAMQSAVFALRRLIMDMAFQDTAKVFGGPERSDRVAGMFDTLKKNYEEDLKGLYEQKKLGPYLGLTKTVTVPEFTLPGGRSRWFRYLFKGA